LNGVSNISFFIVSKKVIYHILLSFIRHIRFRV